MTADSSHDVGHYFRSDGDASAHSYLRAEGGLGSWVLSLDHKRVAILYLATLTSFFLLGTLFASLMRIELVSSRRVLVSAGLFNRLFKNLSQTGRTIFIESDKYFCSDFLLEQLSQFNGPYIVRVVFA